MQPEALVCVQHPLNGEIAGASNIHILYRPGGRCLVQHGLQRGRDITFEHFILQTVQHYLYFIPGGKGLTGRTAGYQLAQNGFMKPFSRFLHVLLGVSIVGYKYIKEQSY
jgi:hypothetical protein